jgi:4-hydroxythreonine-4-phosphate dehydrogenase
MMTNSQPLIPVADPSIHPPRLAITQGDPAGIGPEVILKALADPTLAAQAAAGQVTIVGNRALLQQTYDRLCASVTPLAHPDQIAVLEIPLEAAMIGQIQPGVGNAASGAASFRFLETAIAQTLQGTFQGIVTAPIAKSAWKAAGHLYPGQTELLAEKARATRYGMLFVARSPHSGWMLRTLLATTHIPLRQVADALTPDLLTRKLELLVECLQQDFGIAQPRIAIAGLNPHSGEQGQLGSEEQAWLLPWLQTMRERLPHTQLEGLIPPDTLWVRPGQAWYGQAGFGQVGFGQRKDDTAAPAHDAYLALYHDQGLIPVKLMAFDRAVNTTIGLPFVRTSPDHGTAFDIVDRGIADATSLQAAIQLAGELVQRRQPRALTSG